MLTQRVARTSSPGEDASVSGVLGRTNNFRLAFLSDTDSTIAGLSGKLLRDSLGSLWTKFVEERPDLAKPAFRAVELEVQKIRELQSHRYSLAGESEMPAGLADKAEREIAVLAEGVRKAIEPCFDELVRRGADPELLWR